MNKFSIFNKKWGIFGILPWLILTYLVGLLFLDMPPLDDHNWRQTLTLMVARNFMAPDASIFYPKYDIGKAPGVLASEFPFYNYVLAQLYKIFGYNDWSGRWLNWTVTFIGFGFFYKTLKKFNGHWMAFYATFFLMFSVVIIYARKTMPDTFALSLVLIGIYYAWNFLEKVKWSDGLLAFLFLSLGFLNKISFIPPAVLLLIPFFDNKNPLKAKLYFSGYMLVTISMIGFWYAYWMPHLEAVFANQLIWPKTLQEGWEVVLKYPKEHLNVFKRNAYQTPISFYFSLAGIFIALLFRDFKFLAIFILYSMITFVFVLKTAMTFHTHEYYVILYIPMMAMSIGYFLDKITLKRHELITALPLLLVTLSLGYYPLRRLSEDIQYGQTTDLYLLTLESKLDKFISKTDSVMVNNGFYNPSLTYFTGRKGWTGDNNLTLKKEWMPDFKKNGLKLIIINKRFLQDTLPYKMIYEDEHFRFYKP